MRIRNISGSNTIRLASVSLADDDKMSAAENSAETSCVTIVIIGKSELDKNIVRNDVIRAVTGKVCRSKAKTSKSRG